MIRISPPPLPILYSRAVLNLLRLVLAFVMAASVAGMAQPAAHWSGPMTVEEAIAFALAHNPRLQVADSQWRAAQSASREAAGAFAPKVSAGVYANVGSVPMIGRLRQAGVPRDEAVARAAPSRLRPILMTNSITVLTMIPVAFFPGPGIDAYSPLAVVVMGGLFFGTAVNLVVTPLMHTLVDDLSESITGALGRMPRRPRSQDITRR